MTNYLPHRSLNLENLYPFKKIKIKNHTYICLERLETMRHIDMTSNCLVHPNSWIVVSVINNINFIFCDNILIKTSPYFLYNSENFNKNSSITEWLSDVGYVSPPIKSAATKRVSNAAY